MYADIPTPGLTLAYLPCPEGAVLIRLYGDTPCPVLPDRVDGLPLIALGDYCLADRQRPAALPPENTLRRYTVPGAPASENRIGGNFLQALTLPDSVVRLGSCALYNCRKLAALSVGPGLRTLGSDVFLNTFALARLTLRARPDASTGLPNLVDAVTGTLQVDFAPAGQPLATAHYPEYWTEVEENPAHMLVQSYVGQGYHYRQCFAGSAVAWAEYDAVFPQSQGEDPPRLLTRLALDRLRRPFALGETAHSAYRAYLAGQATACITALLNTDDTAALADLLALDILDEAALDAAAGAARKADNAAFAALLTDAAAQKRPAPAAGAGRYDLDF